MSPLGRGPDLHLYDQEGRWCGGGSILPDLTRAEVIARLSAFVARYPHEPGPRSYRWADSDAPARPIPSAKGGEEGGAVFARDVRDRHLIGALAFEGLTNRGPDLEQQIARATARCGYCEHHPSERSRNGGCPLCKRSGRG